MRRPGGGTDSRGGRGPDVLVVGGGPSGSTVAGLLALRGWSVEILERHRFPRPKPCGECVNPGAIELLRRLKLVSCVRALSPAPLFGWELTTDPALGAVARFDPEKQPNGAVTGLGSYALSRAAEAQDRAPISGLGIDRRRLDHALLVEARRRGAAVREGARVTTVERTREGLLVRLRIDGREEERRPRVLIGADGLRSVVARRLGAHRRRPRLRKVSLTYRVRGRGPRADVGRLHLTRRGTLGLAPVSPPGPDGRVDWNVTLVARGGPEARDLTRDPEDALVREMRLANVTWDGEIERLGGPWASGPFDWPADPAPCRGALLVGDAAGYYDPLTGQGIYRALRSAELAAEAVDRGLTLDRSTLPDFRAYSTRLRRELRPARALQRCVEWIVTRDGARRFFLRQLARHPAAGSLLVTVLGDARPVTDLLRPHALVSAMMTTTADDPPHPTRPHGGCA